LYKTDRGLDPLLQGVNEIIRTSMNSP